VIRSLPRGFTRRKIFPGLIYRNFFHFGESDFAHNTKKVMTKQSPNTAPQEFKDIVRLACLEVWSGNRRVNHAVELPGLTGWIYSDPVAPAELFLGADGLMSILRNVPLDSPAAMAERALGEITTKVFSFCGNSRADFRCNPSH
jgi:hypothetical protein